MPPCLGVVASSAIQEVPSLVTRIGRARDGLRALLLVAVLLGLGAAGARAATLTVNTLSDSNDGSCATTCSLRDAITNANPGDSISFNVTGTITLTSALPQINNLTISGPGANQLTISGAKQYGIFTISSGTVSISGLTLVDGSATWGGGIYEHGSATLTVSNCTFSGNSALAGGGIVYVTSVAVDGSGNVFVSDSGHNAVKEILAAGGNLGSVKVGSTTAGNARRPKN